MADQQVIDAYHRWLGIPREEQPPHLYRLLGLQLFEANPEVIEAAADRQMAYLRTMQTGQHAKLSQQILNELSAAKVTLLNPAKRTVYDQQLRQQLGQQQATNKSAEQKPLPKAVPLASQPKQPPQTRATHPQLVTRNTSTMEAQPSVLAEREARSKRQTGWLLAGAAALLAFAVAAFMILTSSSTGDVVVVSNVPGVELDLVRDGILVETVKVSETKSPLKVQPGDYRVVLRGQMTDDLIVENQEFTLPRDGKVTVKIALREPAPVVAQDVPEAKTSAETKTDPYTLALKEKKEPAPIPAEPKTPTETNDLTALNTTPTIPPVAETNPKALPVVAEKAAPEPSDSVPEKTDEPADAVADAESEEAGPAEVVTSEVICETLAAKMFPPRGLVERAQAFLAPDGDGRRGANGFVLTAPSGWRQRGTVWSGTYRRSGSAYGMYLIHPLADGHVVVSVGKEGMTIASASAWPDRGQFRSPATFPLDFKVPTDAIRIDNDEPHEFRSDLSVLGNFRFYLDGKLVATGKVPAVQTLVLSNEGFRAENLERKLAPGTAGAIVDRMDNGSNKIVDLKLALPNSEDGLMAVPQAEALEGARNSLNDIFKNEIAAARTPEQQSELAKRFLELAIQNDENPADHFVVLEESRKYATEAGDVEVAVEAAQSTANTYRVERWPLLAETVTLAAKKARGQALQGAAEKAFELGQEALATRQFEPANELLETAATTATRARIYPIAKAARERLKDAESQIEAAQEYRAAKEMLATQPDDPRSNQIVGEYLCFEMEDWEQGLPKLLAGGDANLQPIVKMELATPDSKDKQVALGDAWWTLGNSNGGVAKTHYLSRAAKWYKQALPEVTGLEKAKISKRLDSLGN